jgi:phenylpropionate dioxygenase-like ring-hydroxylating dioxygenase large terminal subunit
VSDAYIKNVWYMAAWQEEVDEAEMMPRKLLDIDWLLYKLENGGYAMIRDRCPHRFAPLHMGRRCGDLIECGYHGLRFAPDGKCVSNPFSDLIPPGADLPSRKIVARWGILWFWAGEPSEADEEAIPDFAFLEETAPMAQKHIRMDANFEILSDNLMDLSHVEFVHRDSFQSGGALMKGRHEARSEDDGTIWSCWSVEDVAAPRFAVPLADAPADRWTRMRWNAPATMFLEVGAAPAGAERTDPRVCRLRNPHIITPETQTTSHYFYNCFPGPESEAFAKRVFDEEDRPILEAVQREMDGQDFWEMRPVILNVDAGAVRARRRLSKMRREEAESVAG